MKTAKIKITQYFEIAVARSQFYKNMTEADIKACLLEHVFDNVVKPQELHHLHKEIDHLTVPIYMDSPNVKSIIAHHTNETVIYK